MSGLPKEIKITKDGGNYWRAMAFRHAFTYVILIPVAILILIAVINPLWFRDDFFRWVESSVNKIAQWRNYRVYSMYLGMDPKVWHALKD